jgi:hypothetical protein
VQLYGDEEMPKPDLAASPSHMKRVRDEQVVKAAQQAAKTPKVPSVSPVQTDVGDKV